jgi:hypothetical protein
VRQALTTSLLEVAAVVVLLMELGQAVAVQEVSELARDYQ